MIAEQMKILYKVFLKQYGFVKNMSMMYYDYENTKYEYDITGYSGAITTEVNFNVFPYAGCSNISISQSRQYQPIYALGGDIVGYIP